MLETTGQRASGQTALTPWVANWEDAKIFAYHQPPATLGDNALKALALSLVALSPAFVAGIVGHGDSVAILPEDVDANVSGHQVVLAEGDNRIALAVIAANGAVAAYTIVVRRPAAVLPSQARAFVGSSVGEGDCGRPLRFRGEGGTFGGIRLQATERTSSIIPKNDFPILSKRIPLLFWKTELIGHFFWDRHFFRNNF